MIESFEMLQKANAAIGTTNIKGKEYAEVNQRVKAFRMLCPGGTISTEMLSSDGDVCVFKAYVLDEGGNLLGTGTAFEEKGSSYINKTSYIENCETSAVGRALGFAGFGIDTAIRSAEEVKIAIEKQEEYKAEDVGKQRIDAVKVKALKARCEADGVSVEKLCELYKVNALEELTEKKFANIHEHWDKIKA